VLVAAPTGSEESGHTNEILRVDAGTQIFELGSLKEEKDKENLFN